MKDITEYKQETSVFELSAHLYEKIINGNLKTFSDLKNYCSKIPKGPQLQIILMNAFKLIRNLYWGFFKDIDYPSYPKIWKEMVIPDEEYKYAGNLKRNMTISSIYIAMMDIHGYTKFCRLNNRNLSMLELLDDFMQADISKISQENNVVSRRARGDEIILIGTSGTDIINSVLSIIDYFGKRKIIKSDELAKSRPGVKIMLPDMHITAGIAGGRIYTPLIITEDGDISGDIVNTAARLQARANRISPKDTRVVLTKHVRYQYLKEQKRTQESGGPDLHFFNSGTIAFKGTSIPLYYLVFRKKDFYILDFQNEMLELYESINSNLWKNRVFPNLIKLLIKVLQSMPGFKIVAESGDGKKIILRNAELIELSKKILKYYMINMDYSKALKLLDRLILYLSKIPSFDTLVFQYIIDIQRNYRIIADIYNSEIENLLDNRIEKILSLEERKTYYLVKSHFHIYEKLRNQVRKNDSLTNRKAVWYKIIEDKADIIALSIYSGKI
jgi:hypothetical protein